MRRSRGSLWNEFIDGQGRVWLGMVIPPSSKSSKYLARNYHFRISCIWTKPDCVIKIPLPNRTFVPASRFPLQQPIFFS